jgi:hypothetical protein
MPIFAPADIIRWISYIFKVGTLKKKDVLKNESTYPFHKCKENPPILQSLVEGHFYFVYFSLKFSFFKFIPFKQLLL